MNDWYTGLWRCFCYIVFRLIGFWKFLQFYFYFMLNIFKLRLETLSTKNRNIVFILFHTYSCSNCLAFVEHYNLYRRTFMIKFTWFDKMFVAKVTRLISVYLTRLILYFSFLFIYFFYFAFQSFFPVFQFYTKCPKNTTLT